MRFATEDFVRDNKSLSMYFADQPTADEELVRFVVAVPFEAPANLVGSQANAATNPTASATFTFLKNGTSFGTVVIATNGTATFTATATSFTTGDLFSVVAPDPQDATLADVSISLLLEGYGG